ncbi:MAG TPA: hypothetical protein VJA21_27645 [Verrucomicrobiae bacterium]
MNSAFALVAVNVLAGALSAAAQHSEPAKAPRFAHPLEITNPYLPLGLLKQDVLEGKEGKKKIRVERTARPDLQRAFVIGGQNVPALAVEDREFENGTLVEVAIDYFAQADDGTVYYFGETVDEYKDGKVAGHPGAWMLGVQTDKPGVMMPGHPKRGDRFRAEDVPKITTEDDEVISLSETVTVPAGAYKNCLKIKEVMSDGAIDHKFYAKELGCVKETTEDGELLLISHTARTNAAAAKKGASGQSDPPLQDKLARDALFYVGADPFAELYWMEAINDPSLSGHERSDLIEDLNEDGLSDWDNPGPQDLPLIISRLELIQELAPFAMDQVNADAFQEAHKDLWEMFDRLTRP